MRFTSDASPSLTPLGSRLLHISERKLSTLDGIAYDEGFDLRKGILVREAVRSAWQSVSDGEEVEMTNWSSHSAMGLEVYEEEEEVDLERSEQRWFEDIVTSLDEEEDEMASEHEHEWVESNVTIPEDLEFNVDGMEAFTFTSPTAPSTPAPEPAHCASTSCVDVVEVDDDESDISDEDMIALTQSTHWSLPTTTHLEYANSPPLSPLPEPSPLQIPAALYPGNDDYFTGFEEYVDDFSALPPPLLRSMSSSTTSSEGDDTEVCGTPPMRAEELSLEEDEDEEEEIDWKEQEALYGMGLKMGGTDPAFVFLVQPSRLFG
ncbi:hypothetical protein B9479_000188 [Cryptococcus floricola]|uniref:Uncharacterized protein n=1 Tax=Cryptococcus floricola TaxID=2591691 RepID=A0A5D3B928_9TREE|nr:hypothetical protein B9479_000188 [Cryptococcus floricola]